MLFLSTIQLSLHCGRRMAAWRGGATQLTAKVFLFIMTSFISSTKDTSCEEFNKIWQWGRQCRAACMICNPKGRNVIYFLVFFEPRSYRTVNTSLLQQDRQCTYNVTSERVRATTVSVEKRSTYLHALNVSAALVIQLAKCTPCNIYAVQQDTQSVLMSKFIQHLC